LISALLKLLEDPNIDVSTAAAEALESWRRKRCIAGSSRIMGFETLANEDCGAAWYPASGGARASNESGYARSRIPKFILTSTDFRPHFEIKFAYKR